MPVPTKQMNELTRFPFIVSFVSGILTFISPCVLPLIPAYISFVTGTSLDEIQNNEASKTRFFGNTLFFVLGFSAVFILLGATASYLGNIVTEQRDLLRIVGGSIVIVFGIHFTGIIPIKMLYREKRVPLKMKSFGYLGAFFVGLAFAIGWTPCVGPILSSILILASAQETVYRGVGLLAAYSLGLGIPFILTALFVNFALRLFKGIGKYYRYIEISAGAILIMLGILLVTDNFRIVERFFAF